MFFKVQPFWKFNKPKIFLSSGYFYILQQKNRFDLSLEVLLMSKKTIKKPGTVLYPLLVRRSVTKPIKNKPKDTDFMLEKTPIPWRVLNKIRHNISVSSVSAAVANSVDQTDC